MDKIITEGLPEDVPLVTDFNHPYNRLDYYHPRLVETGVPVPETKFFDVSVEQGTPNFDEGAISEYMVEMGWRQAFVRGMYASAKIDPVKGSCLRSQDRNDIRETIGELIVQHIILDRPLGERIAVRKMIDLDYCPNKSVRHLHHNEVRYIIENGSVNYRFPDEEEFVERNLDCPDTFPYVKEDMKNGVSYPDHLAERVAREFDELSWSVDFVRDAKTGEWYCPDMGLNGLYWNETTEKWVSISGQPKEREPSGEDMPSIERLNRKI